MAKILKRKIYRNVESYLRRCPKCAGKLIVRTIADKICVRYFVRCIKCGFID